MECALGWCSAGSSQDYDDCRRCIWGHESRIEIRAKEEKTEKDRANGQRKRKGLRGEKKTQASNGPKLEIDA